MEYFKLYQYITEFWHDTYGDLLHTISYEKLTTSPESEIKDLLKFVELKFEPSCLTPETNDRAVITASQTQVRKPIYTGSSENWKKFEPFFEGVFDEIM